MTSRASRPGGRNQLFQHLFQSPGQQLQTLVRQAVVITANLALGVDQHQVRGVEKRHDLVAGIVAHRQLEALLAQIPDLVAPTGQKAPMAIVGPGLVGVLAQHFRGIVLRIHTDADQTNISPAGVIL